MAEQYLGTPEEVKRQNPLSTMDTSSALDFPQAFPMDPALFQQQDPPSPQQGFSAGQNPFWQPDAASPPPGRFPPDPVTLSQQEPPLSQSGRSTMGPGAPFQQPPGRQQPLPARVPTEDLLNRRVRPFDEHDIREAKVALDTRFRIWLLVDAIKGALATQVRLLRTFSPAGLATPPHLGNVEVAEVWINLLLEQWETDVDRLLVRARQAVDIKRVEGVLAANADSMQRLLYQIQIFMHGDSISQWWTRLYADVISVAASPSYPGSVDRPATGQVSAWLARQVVGGTPFPIDWTRYAAFLAYWQTRVFWFSAFWTHIWLLMRPSQGARRGNSPAWARARIPLAGLAAQEFGLRTLATGWAPRPVVPHLLLGDALRAFQRATLEANTTAGNTIHSFIWRDIVQKHIIDRPAPLLDFLHDTGNTLDNKIQIKAKEHPVLKGIALLLYGAASRGRVPWPQAPAETSSGNVLWMAAQAWAVRAMDNRGQKRSMENTPASPRALFPAHYRSLQRLWLSPPAPDTQPVSFAERVLGPEAYNRIDPGGWSVLAADMRALADGAIADQTEIEGYVVADDLVEARGDRASNTNWVHRTWAPFAGSAEPKADGRGRRAWTGRLQMAERIGYEPPAWVDELDIVKMLSVPAPSTPAKPARGDSMRKRKEMAGRLRRRLFFLGP